MIVEDRADVSGRTATAATGLIRAHLTGGDPARSPRRELGV
ncbi:hypothetical protein [Amycolatopsis vancoresmycina]|nr:hypothetical protein [Amycolatopsis vancoresmycina]